jgi:predicted nucleotidyltransferase
VTEIPLDKLQTVVDSQPYPLFFATVSGAHLYGFPSPDSDFDLRGAHILPLYELVGLNPPEETIQVSEMRDGLEIDLVSHDAKKCLHLLLRPNGYVLEQIYSPLIVRTSDFHTELKQIAPGCITRHHVEHYLGFYRTQRHLFDKESPPRVKPLLYIYRVLLTGIHLMRSGELEANLVNLNMIFRLPYIYDLIARKVTGQEKSTFAEADLGFHHAEFERLVSALEQAGQESKLPEAPRVESQLNKLLLTMRGL